MHEKFLLFYQVNGRTKNTWEVQCDQNITQNCMYIHSFEIGITLNYHKISSLRRFVTQRQNHFYKNHFYIKSFSYNKIICYFTTQ